MNSLAVKTPPLEPTAWIGGWAQGLRYGALGLPLAFVALPLYVVLPKHYASAFGIPLATLGALLLGARLLDAVADPWIGRLVDRWFAQATSRVLGITAIAAVVLALGFRGLFFPLVSSTHALLLWCAAFLTITYLSYSVLSVVHQAWGARLGGDEAQRARIVSWREGLALLGVLVASVLPSVAGLSVSSMVFAALLLIAVSLLWRAPSPSNATRTPDGDAAQTNFAGPSGPFATPGFRRLLGIYLVNGVASAVPATLILFFIEDRLQAAAYTPLFLFSFFAAGALSMPLWLRLVQSLGLARAWLLGMLLSIVAFIGAAFLGSGDIAGYAAVCMASGIALGADLSLPGALLAGVIQRAGHGQQLEGAYFGWWNFATKLNLALAAGIALPLLAAFGYAPGGRSEDALLALSIAYCVLPCLLKLFAAALLWWLWLRKEPSVGANK
jgi:glycoside/pentoside/hexuronide:cation symporter, GPH family